MFNAILSAGLVTVSAPNTNVKGDLESSKVRYQVCPGYRTWCMETFQAEERGIISREERIDLFTRVKDACIYNYNNAGIKQTTQVTEVVVDEVAKLKAELEAVKAADNAKALKIKDLEVNLTVAEAKNSKYEDVLSRLQKRTVVIGNVVTKAYIEVAAKVGI